MMRKKENYRIITPIPSHIPRQLAIDILHSHGEIITLNPLVLGYNPIPAPRDAAADEYYATWYEIHERIQYIPGVGKLGSGKISFKGCFHDVPRGVDTHILAPAGVDLRNNYRVCGNQPGEPPEARELGINAPAEGLYLREDIQIKCNFTMVSFVKSQMKAASKVMIERFVMKADMVEVGELRAMMEDGKIKTINPADRSKTMQTLVSQGSQHHIPSPQLHPMSPPLNPSIPQQYQSQQYQQQQPPMSPHMPYQIPRSPQLRPGTGGTGVDHSNRYSYMSNPQQNQQYNQQYNQQQQYIHPENPGLGLQGGGGKQFTQELPGDFYHPAPPDTQHLNPPSYSPNKHHRESTVSELSGYSPDSNSNRWSDMPKSPNGSRPISTVSDTTSGMRSPGLDQKSFAAELPTMEETQEEYDKRRAAESKHREAYGTTIRPDARP